MRKFLSLGAVIAALIVTPAQAEVVVLTDDAFVTRDSVTVEADLREAWLHLISPGKWWNEAHTFSGDAANLMLRPQAGGCFCETIPPKDTVNQIGLAGSVEHMRVILAMPDQALRMNGALGPLQSEPVNGVLTVTLAESEAGTRLVFEYAVAGYMRYETPPISKAVDGVISEQMMSLAGLLGPVEGSRKVTAELEQGEEGPVEELAEEEQDPAETGEEAASEDEVSEEKKAPKISVDEAFGDLTIDD